MINFIVCDDEKIITEVVKNIITKMREAVENGYDVEYIELNDGHMFPESRIELACRIIAYLNEMEKR